MKTKFTIKSLLITAIMLLSFSSINAQNIDPIDLNDPNAVLGSAIPGRTVTYFLSAPYNNESEYNWSITGGIINGNTEVKTMGNTITVTWSSNCNVLTQQSSSYIAVDLPSNGFLHLAFDTFNVDACDPCAGTINGVQEYVDDVILTNINTTNAQKCQEFKDFIEYSKSVGDIAPGCTISSRGVCDVEPVDPCPAAQAQVDAIVADDTLSLVVKCNQILAIIADNPTCDLVFNLNSNCP